MFTWWQMDNVSWSTGSCVRWFNMLVMAQKWEEDWEDGSKENATPHMLRLYTQRLPHQEPPNPTQVATWSHINNRRHQVPNILYDQDIDCTSQTKPLFKYFAWSNPHQISTQSQATKHQFHCGVSRHNLSNKQSVTPSTPHLIIYILRHRANPHIEMEFIETRHYLKNKNLV